ncbi:Lrp/AsnC family transcriptional regulator [Phyllobacterium endophyticum]|uniref:AsnC family transcriptional regulator n=1 Tax=Phyllobacterium endophyticum TaxID=1149773 RepID=A0A2P7AS96_9HYPH|nr:Lrp/AsnC family transcriptional regulator [Phyllobacterium endophyticum]MBB3236837.1 Lrp/AsnC family leucine-responsive transcriptional regulator [Phyllobacterium endophyticum]PSH57101.1 AsnC family transcriptional regulator [Phyllobacterium endophyticum]TYR40380.1 Lrp/AsnC family transcriptional regulator [Phyllobacterium endophyticum]
MSNNTNFALDAIDLKILLELQTDARLPNITLADRVGLSPSPCSRRVKLLEDAGVIEGYRAVLSRQAVGLGLTVFAGVRVERHAQDQADAFVEAVLAMPEVIACHLVSGDVDFLVEVVVPDMATYEATVLRQLLSLATVRDIRSGFAMRSYSAGRALPLDRVRNR